MNDDFLDKLMLDRQTHIDNGNGPHRTMPLTLNEVAELVRLARKGLAAEKLAAALWRFAETCTSCCVQEDPSDYKCANCHAADALAEYEALGENND